MVNSFQGLKAMSRILPRLHDAAKRQSSSGSIPPFGEGRVDSDGRADELFGGFGRDFYAAYTETWPLDPGYRVRKTLYNLYHILNHLNLFGSGYLGQAEGMIERLLGELG